MIWRGYLLAPQDGAHQFSYVSNGDCELYIEDRRILGDFGADAAEIVNLSKGPHRITIRYKHLDSNVTPSFRLEWKPPGGETGVVPLEVLTPSKYTIPR